MEDTVIMQMAKLASKPEAVERTVTYLETRIRTFLKKKELVLLCFEDGENSIGRLLEQAVLRCEGIPVWMGKDRRWVSILRKAFSSKCNAIFGTPLLLLGLAKLAKHMGIPLYARNVLLTGYPSPQWMIDGIQRGLDCKAWGCFDPLDAPVVAGFSCVAARGVHLRSDEYAVDIVDEQGNILKNGEMGEVILFPTSAPELRFPTGYKGRIDDRCCVCGCDAPMLVDINTNVGIDATISQLGESLHYWSSILDCRLEKTAYGLELELVVFPGEKLPKLPNCAKMLVRPLEPENDEPFPHLFVMRNRFFPDSAH